MPVASVDDAFRELLSRIELSPFRLILASQRCNAIKASIESVLPGTTAHPIGSFERKTKIRPADHSDQLDVEVLAISLGVGIRSVDSRPQQPGQPVFLESSGSGTTGRQCG